MPDPEEVKLLTAKDISDIEKRIRQSVAAALVKQDLSKLDEDAWEFPASRQLEHFAADAERFITYAKAVAVENRDFIRNWRRMRATVAVLEAEIERLEEENAELRGTK